MKISRVNVKGLWNKFDLDWNLRPDVNILSGANGVGKSTLLRSMWCILNGNFVPEQYNDRLRSVEIDLDNDVQLCLLIIKDKYESLKKQAKDNKTIAGLVQRIDKEQSDKRLLNIRPIEAQGLEAIEDGQRVKPDDAVAKINSAYISTFDCAPPKPDNPGVLIDYLMKSSFSELDRHLEGIVEKFKSYQIELSNRLAKMMAGGDSGYEDIKLLLQYREQMYDILDRMFNETGKRVNRDKGDVEFIFSSDGESHSYTDLSAGEKQLVLILLTVFMQEKRPAILIMDEPEISLHVDWQREIIDVIRGLNPECQIIVATHSPSMILNSWRNAVVNIQDLIVSGQAN